MNGLGGFFGEPPKEDDCTERWDCGDWTSCTEQGSQTRACTDLNSCGTIEDKPGIQKNCDVEDLPPTDEGSPHALGEQKIAVILYTTSNDSNTFGRTKEDFYREIFSETNGFSFNNYLKEISYGKTWMTGFVTPWLHFDTEYPFLQDIITAADPYIDYSETKRIIMIRPRSFGILGGASTDYVNYTTNEGRQGLQLTSAYYNPSDGVPDYSRQQIITQGFSTGYGFHLLAHEYGHTLQSPLGVKHAVNLYCIEPPFKQTTPYKITDDGELDPSCIVFGVESYSDQLGAGKGHHNTIIKEKVGWLQENQILEIEQGESGIYTLNPLETAEGIKVIKIPRVRCSTTGEISDPCGGDGVGWYYLEYRRNIGNDRPLFLPPIVDYEGVEIRIDGYLVNETVSSEIVYSTDYRSSLLLDMNVNDPFSHVLGKGETFTDPHQGTVIEIEDLTDERVLVKVVFENSNDGED